MLAVQSQPVVSDPTPSGTSKFTCLTCQVAFATSELQRSHYHTDWHKYNLKRKVAELVPVSAEQFIEKVTALQAQDQEEREQSFLAYNCAICRKRYGSEAAFKSHLRSRKHNESKHDQGISMADEFMTVPTNTATVMTMGDTQRDSCLHCLFCDERQDQFSDNIHHMSVSHGFFLPDIEYLVDAQGLVKYLSTKIQSDYMCLYCNKTLKSAQAAMSHMVNKGHCKMAYDDTEDVDALLRYYDFGSPLNENDDDVSTTTIASEEGELILHDGTRLGNRRLLKYYKQKHQTTSTGEKQQHHNSNNNMIDDGDDNSNNNATMTTIQEGESLYKNRWERRHQQRAISYGDAQQLKIKKMDSITEANWKKMYYHHVGIKNNTTTRLRLRLQVPII